MEFEHCDVIMDTGDKDFVKLVLRLGKQWHFPWLSCGGRGLEDSQSYNTYKDAESMLKGYVKIGHLDGELFIPLENALVAAYHGTPDK